MAEDQTTGGASGSWSNYPTTPDGQAILQDSNGQLQTVDPSEVDLALKPIQEGGSGWAPADPAAVDLARTKAHFKSPGQKALALAEAAARVPTFGLSTPLEMGIGEALNEPGLSGEAILAREKLNPLTSTVGTGVGFLNPIGATKLIVQSGKAGAEALGLTGQTILHKVGSAATKGAIESALLQSENEVHKMFAGDPDQTVGSAVQNIGLAGLISIPIAGGLGAISPLWNATAGPKVTKFLKAVTDKAGGIESALPNEVTNAIDASGIQVDPTIKSALSNDPEMRQAFQTLQESSSKSGAEAQDILKNFKNQANEALVSSLGKSAEDLLTVSDLSNHEVGKSVQAALAEDIKNQYKPISEIFGNIENKFKNVNINPQQQTAIQEKIGQLIQEKGYYLSPSSAQAKIINTTLDELSGVQTLDDLKKYTSIINEKTNSPELWKVGGDLRRIFRGAENDIVSETLGKEAPELLTSHSMGRAAYQDIMGTLDTLNDRLHVGRYKGVDSFVSALKDMAPEDVIRRLSGKGDADLLHLVENNFPGVANQIKSWHVDSVLKNAVDRAAPGEMINSKALFKSIEKLSPELQKFAFPEAGPSSLTNKFSSIKALLEGLPEKMNTSGTAKTLDSLWKKVPGSMMSMVSWLTTHNPYLSFLMSPLTDWVSRDAPDAMKLGMLKMFGSSEPISAPGFKAMVDFINKVQKGENLSNKAVKNVFKSGETVLPTHLIPGKYDTDKLDKKLKDYQADSTPLFNLGGSLSHYLPDHAVSISKTASTAVQYLNDQRPQLSKQAPLDQDPKVSRAAEAQYQRTLEVAQQPLVVLKHIKDGTLLPNDVKTFRALYEPLYQRLNQKLTSEIVEATSRGEQIPYKTRLNLSLFMGEPLDSTMTPFGIQIKQPIQNPMIPPPSQKHMSQSSASGMEKLSKMSLTQGQLSESRRLK